MQSKTLRRLVVLAGAMAISHAAIAGETLDRIKKNGELVGVMDQVVLDKILNMGILVQLEQHGFFQKKTFSTNHLG